MNKIKELYDWVRKQIYSVATMISPELNTKMRFKYAFKRELDLDNPITFNEKILWLKLKKYMSDPLVIKCADKYRVREYISQCGCDEILINLIGAYDKVDDIPWDQLPNQFVIKWNFGATFNIICLDKSQLDINATIHQLKKWGRTKYWLPHSEMQYKNMPKKIIIEQLLSSEDE